MIELYNVKLGSGPRVIFVHGDGPSQGGEESFAGQRGLADEFELIFLDRHGYGNNPST
jgi:pimeloyl-ACP methyl ester carboxylesterase